MIVARFIISFSIFTFICLPMIVLSTVVVAILLLTSWDGRTTIFGNTKWGRATSHPDHPTTGYWSQFSWLVLRNPVNNLSCGWLAVGYNPLYRIYGKTAIGDKIAGGFYRAQMGDYWEYYYIVPYRFFGSARCVRLRFGWKIVNSDKPCAFCFSFNPWKSYGGK